MEGSCAITRGRTSHTVCILPLRDFSTNAKLKMSAMCAISDGTSRFPMNARAADREKLN